MYPWKTVFFDTQNWLIRLFFAITMEKAQFGSCSSDTGGVLLINTGFSRGSVSVSLVTVRASDRLGASSRTTP